MFFRVGFCGAGFVAKFHLEALRYVPGVTLEGVYALNGAKDLAKRARDYGVGGATVYDSVKDLCESGVNAICIFVPNFARLEIMQQIAEASKNNLNLWGVICEKPLARNVKEANKMVELAKGANLRTAYFENQIHMPSVCRARIQLAAVEKVMGPVHLTRSAEEHGGPHEPWFWDPTKQGGGVWCDMGCHSIAVGMYMLTPSNEAPDFLEPVSINATMALLKWGEKPWINKLRERGVDYDKTPAEDYALVTASFRNPITGQLVMAQATDSWMYEAPGLRLLMEAMGPGYAYTVDSLRSPAGLFISDTAAEAVRDAEIMLEKAQASRGALVLQPNEADLYGYVGEWQDVFKAFEEHRDALLNFEYGLLITKLVMAGYLAHEKGHTINFGDAEDLLTAYIPAIQQGIGKQIL